MNFFYSQSLNPHYKLLVDSVPNQVFGFAIKKSQNVRDLFVENNFLIKYESKTHLYVNAPLKWMDDNSRQGNIPHYNFNPMPAKPLGDTVRARRFVDPVHAGTGLSQAYTGKDVVIGFIDFGIDFRHPDFLDTNGNTRVLRVWDQNNGTSFGAYGYGRLWDSTAINNGSCNTVGSGDHGSTVAGMGAGNGLANGKNKGISPDSKIVFINLNMNSGYYTRIADACDYIFKFADSLGLPAVVNLGIGGPMGGAHDGNDPYTEYVESLLTAKNGRIVIASAGNYGGYGNYHLRGEVTPDTTFTWFESNDFTAVSFGNGVYFDLYADTSASHFDFSFGLDKPAPSYGFRGGTNFRNTHSNLDTYVYDTIWSGVNQMAVIRTYEEIVDSAYHLNVFVNLVDSSNYRVRFMTKGVGAYDLWSSSVFQLNSSPPLYYSNIVENIPSALIVPEIVNYQLPDSLNTLAAYFMNSEKIITVGNFNNRQSYIDLNGNYQDYTAFPSGEINPGSSRGPNRLNHMKPDVSANGNLSFAAAGLSTLSNSVNNNRIIQEGWHIRNGGTSMAAPVISGMAALYLEKCPNASFSDFKRDIINASEKDSFTGPIANYSYGHGKPNALKLLLDKDSIQFNILNTGTYICNSPVNLSISTHPSLDSVLWSSNSNLISLSVNTPNFYSAEVYYGDGCKAYTDTLEIISILPSLPDSLSVTQPTCTLPEGEIEIVSQTNVFYSLGGVLQFSNVFSSLSPSSYLITVKSQLDTTCFFDATATIVLSPPTSMTIDPIDPISFCDTSILQIITGVSLSGNEGYYTELNRAGTRYNALDVIDTSIYRLYVNDSLGVCTYEDSVFFVSYKPDIPILLSVVQPTCVLPFGDIQITTQSNVEYTLGNGLQSSNTFNGLDAGSYILTIKNQVDTLCLNSEPIPVVIVMPLNMTIDPVLPISFCDTLILPAISGVSLSGNEAYYTLADRGGVQYNSLEVIDTTITKLYISDSLGVCSYEDSLFFSIIPGDDASFFISDFCEDTNPIVTISGLSGGVFSFASLPNDGAILEPNSGELLNYAGGNSYYVKYSTNGVCPRSETDTVSVFIIPSEPITDLDSIEIINDQVSVFVNSSNTFVKWYSDSLLTNLLYTGNPYYFVPSTDLYVTETIDGCESSSKRIYMYSLNDIFSTTAFTPNGDNVNDVWILNGIDLKYPNNVVRVINRWGGIVFESVKGDYEKNSWNGKSNGSLLPTGSYYYVVNCNDVKGTKFEGTVTIIK